MQASSRLSSYAVSRRVASEPQTIADVSGVVTRSCYRTCRGKANEAALSGQERPKSQKRISNDERRVQIKEFIDIYKTSNDGKFPTIKMVRQHVGGGHYTVREVLQEVMCNHAKLPLDKPQSAQPHETAQSAEGLRPEEDNGSNSFSPKNINAEQVIDGTLLSQKFFVADTIKSKKTGASRSLELKIPSDSSHCNGQTKTSKQVLYTEDIHILNNGNDLTVSGQAEIQRMKTGTWRSMTPDSSHYAGETEAAMQVSYTTNISKNANDSTISGQTETDSLKTEASMSLGLLTKSEPGNPLGETEATNLHSNNIEKSQNASEPTITSYQKESDKVIEENIVDREEEREAEQQGSTETTLLGTLKSFASGITNFFKKL